MLDYLSKKDKKWREIAFNICKCKDLADELTNRMYLRIYDYKVPIEKLTEGYVGLTIYNLFIDHCKKTKDISIELFHYLPDTTTTQTYSDEDLNLLKKAQELKWWERQLLVESYDKSLRQIEKQFNINYQFVRRHTQDARKRILGDKYKPKSNGKKKTA